MATVTVNYNRRTGTYYLTDENDKVIPGQSLIGTATEAADRANSLGDVELTDEASSGLVNEDSADAASTADETDTPPPDNQGNDNDTSEPEPTEEEREAEAVGSSALAGILEQTFLGPYPNPLGQYPTYTYGLALWMLTPIDFNALSDDPIGWTPSKQSGLIAASGGKYTTSGQYARLLPYFDLDFYIEDLKFQSTLSATSKGKGSTNDLEGSFTIIEPIGLTFVDRMTLAAFNITGGATAVETPFMLEIDFYGAGTDYVIESKSLAKGAYKKRLPIKISKIDINFSSKGTEYKIDWVPFPHSAFEDVHIPVSGKVENVSTVEEFFGGSGSASIGYLNDIRSDPADNENILATSAIISALNAAEQKENQSSYDTIASSQAKASDELNASTGLAYVINQYNFNLAYDESKSNPRSYPDFIKFVIHPDIAKSKIIKSGSTSLKNIPMIAGETSALSDGKTTLTQDGGSYNISAGTSVTELISQVMRNSDYIQDQIPEPSDPDEVKDLMASIPFRWFKVIPKVQLTQWDAKIGGYAKKVTYYIVPYTVNNTQHPLSAQTVPKGKPFKVYNYYYTGKNTEIIDCKINFQASFYQNVMLGNANSELDANATSGDEEASPPPPGKYPNLNGVTVGGIFMPVPTINPRRIKHIVNDQQATSSLGGNRDGKTQAAASVHQSLNSLALGNMLNVNMRILGDPHYIKQDDLLWNPGSAGWVDPNTSPDLFLLTTGSLPFDGGEIYVDLFFLTPTDIDTSTGLANPPLSGGNNPYIPTSFSGRYYILKIDNIFSHGKFEQQLELARYTDQESEAYKETTKEASRETPASTTKTASKAAAKPTATAPASVGGDSPSTEQEMTDLVFRYG